MPNDYPNSDKIKPRRKRLRAGASDALSFRNLVASDNAYPQPWAIAGTVFGHLLLLAAIININPTTFDQEEVMNIAIITPPPAEVKPTPPENIKNENIESKEITQNKAIKPIERQSEKRPIPQSQPEKLQPEKAIDEPIERPKNIIIKPENLKSINRLNLKPSEIKKLSEEEEIELQKVNPVQIQKPKFNKLTAPDLEIKQEYNPQKIEGNPNLKTVSPNLNLPNKNLHIDINRLNQQIDDAQKQQDLARQRALEEQKQAAQKQDSSSEVIATNRNGRISANQGGAVGASGASVGSSASAGSSVGISASSGVTAIGGASGGILPNAPKSYGVPNYNGRNVFEENENNSLLARMGRTADCARLNRERDEKCKDWQPLDGRMGKYIPPKTPNLPAAKPKNVDPLPLCPAGTPASNFGLTCLPENR